MFHPLRTGSTLRNHLRPRKARILIPGLESESVLGLESNSLSLLDHPGPRGEHCTHRDEQALSVSGCFHPRNTTWWGASNPEVDAHPQPLVSFVPQPT